MKPFIPLSSEAIANALSAFSSDLKYDLHVFAKIDSTNLFLKNNQASQSVISVCCAEEQTAGRGRFGRKWSSPFGENIYLSLGWRLKNDLSLQGLSLVIGLAMVEGLKQMGIQENVSIKWPNDLLWNNKKLGGILIELQPVAENFYTSLQLIIGIGINVNSIPPDAAWCSLYEMTQIYFDRNRLIACLLSILTDYIKQFLLYGFGVFKPVWEKSDYLKGRFVTVSTPKQRFSGEALGVTENGELCVRDEEGKLHFILAGDASLRSTP